MANSAAKDRAGNNCRSYARQSVDRPPSGDGSYAKSDTDFPPIVKRHSRTWLAAMASLVILVFASAIRCKVIADDPIPIESIQIHPQRFTLTGARERLQLVVAGVTSDGQRIDLTREVTYEPGDSSFATIDGAGRVCPTGDGNLIIKARYGDHSAETELSVSNAAQTVSFDFQILPVLARSGCSGGACHGSPNGKAGFRLSLFGSDRELDRVSLSRELFGRRVNLIEPEKSLLLRKPTTQVAHHGGKRFDVDDDKYHLLKDWIAEGCATQTPEPACVGIEVFPKTADLLKKFPHQNQQLSVTARLDDGSNRDVTHLATYVSSDPKVAEVKGDGIVVGLGRGEAAIIVRYLHHIATPLMTFVRDIDGFTWRDPPSAGYIDDLVYAKLRQLQYQPAGRCRDEQFIRRVSLDVLGILPDPEEVRSFVADTHEDKRAALVDRLLDRPEHAKFWAQKWGDLLRVSTKLIGTPGVYKFSRWLEHSVATNQPYDQFAREILLATGSTREHPAGNFYRSAADTSDAMETAAQIFLGTRIQCAKCHNHPFERWTQDNYYGLSTFFNRIQRSKTADTEEMLVWSADSGEVTHPATGEKAQPWVPGDAEIEANGSDRRLALANWLAGDGKRMLARIEVNRIWAYLLGRGIVEPFDDFRDSNPPANAPLLEALTDDFITHRYDRRHLLRTILLSNTYQASSTTDPLNRTDSRYFSHYIPRMLTAEQLVDAMGHVTGHKTRFFGVPEETLATWLPAPDLKPHDQSRIGDIEVLKVFGQPARQSACECERGDDASLGQALQLFNGEFVNEMLTDQQNDIHRMLADKVGPEAILDELYVRALSRHPTEAEAAVHGDYLAAHDDVGKAVEDLCWALLNQTEFLFQH